MQARHTELNIIYQGKNISQDIAPYLISFTLNDNASGSADDISISLEDRKGLWLYDWKPSKGDKITCSIIHYESEQAFSLPCGSFQVDQIEYAYPPKVLSIKAVSTAITQGMRHESHNKAWENVKLSTIAGDIASSNNLALRYEGPEYMIDREEQVNIPDLEFLTGICADYGMGVKVRDGKLIVYDEVQNEENESVCELEADDRKILSCKFTSKSAEVFRKAHVKYHDSVKAETYEGEDEDELEEGSERVLEIRERVSSSGEAQRLASKRLYEANKSEVTGSIKLMGDIRFSAGMNIELKNFGMFSGKHKISKVTHSINASGYTTSLELGETQSSKGNKGTKTLTYSP